MLFTRVIFNTYSFFLESVAKAKWTPAFFMFKNSLLLPCCISDDVNITDIFSINAPLKIYLSFKPVTRLLSDRSTLFFLSLVRRPVLNLCLITKNKPTTQGKLS